MEASPQNRRRMCNELVRELCLRIPSAKTEDSILLTAHNVYAYLEPQFNKKLIYREAIAFLKAMKAKENVHIRINQLVKNEESEPIAVINQNNYNRLFVLKTNKFCVWIENENYYVDRNVEFFFYNVDGHLKCAQLHYFLRLIAQVLPPIYLILLDKPIGLLMPFLNALSGYTDSIGLSAEQFNSTEIDDVLGKYNRLKIYDPLSSLDVPKFVHWLTTSNKGQSKICLTNWALDLAAVIPLVEEIKKDFARAKSKRRFVVCLKLKGPLDEFTLCNELTGEKLELRFKNIEYGRFIHALSRFPNNEMSDSDGDFAEFDIEKMTRIML